MIKEIQTQRLILSLDWKGEFLKPLMAINNDPKVLEFLPMCKILKPLKTIQGTLLSLVVHPLILELTGAMVQYPWFIQQVSM